MNARNFGNPGTSGTDLGGNKHPSRLLHAPGGQRNSIQLVAPSFRGAPTGSLGTPGKKDQASIPLPAQSLREDPLLDSDREIAASVFVGLCLALPLLFTAACIVVLRSS